MSAGDWKELLAAAQSGDLELVQYHLKNGVTPNYQHPELLTTPLIESIVFEQLAIAQYLLNHGADPTLRAGFSEDSPLKVAKRTQNKALILLIKTHLPPKKCALSRWFQF